MFSVLASMTSRHCQRVSFHPIATMRSYSGSTCLQMAKKTNSASNDKLFRADRVLANRGMGSRSECFDLLKQRRVFQLIDGDKMERVKGPSEKLSMNASIYIDGKHEVPKPLPLLRVYHKPKWVLSVLNDPHGRPTVADRLEFLSGNKMHPVGRLDYDTSGLLLLSSNGKLTQQLLHPNHEMEKEYVALVVGSVANPDELKEILAKGVTTSMGAFPADLIETKPIPQEQVKGTIDAILQNLPEEYDMDRLDEKGYLFFKDAKELSEIRLVVREGKHRMVRRILANSGFPVIGLKRERMGDILLGDLPAGEYRELSEEEEEWANQVMSQFK